MADSEEARRVGQLIERFAARGLKVSAEQAREFTSVIGRLEAMKADLREAVRAVSPLPRRP